LERNGHYERYNPELAQLGAAVALDTAGMSALQFGKIQTSRIAFRRWPAQYVRATPRSLHVLLAAVLLVFLAWSKCGMSPPLFAVLMGGAFCWPQAKRDATYTTPGIE
jgi:hypothetical protein